MSTKQIKELDRITISDLTDLIAVDQPGGAKAISVGDLVKLFKEEIRASLCGSIHAFAHFPPTGIDWLYCDGSEMPIDTFPRLAEKLGTIWGTASKEGFFKLPDLRGWFLRGVAGSAVPGEATNYLGGAQSDEIKSHNHTSTWTANSIPFNNGSIGETHIRKSMTKSSYYNFETKAGSKSWQSQSSGEFDIVEVKPRQVESRHSISNTGGGETRPRNKGVIYFIHI